MFSDRELKSLDELLTRRRARESLLAFGRYVMPGFKIGRPHRAMAAALERVERGECNRLIISMPRRHGKSLMVSQLFPCWSLGRNNRLRFVQSGYADSLTVTHSRKARDILDGERFAALWPGVGQSGRSSMPQTAHEWGTRQGGNYYAVGIGGGLAGRGFHVGIVDDFFKGRSEAQSPKIRDKVWDWFRSVFYPAQDSDDVRREAAIVITATRWDTRDLIAQVQALSLLEGDDEALEKWEMLKLPAIGADGEALWGERWGLDKLARIKMTIGSREFSAQYMQEPKDLEGGLMQRTWFKVVDDYPRNPGQPWCRYWDLAASEKSAKSADPDWTCGALVTVVGGVWYVVGMRRFRATEATVREAIVQCAKTDPYGTRVRIEQEPGAGSKNLIAAYQRDVLVGVDARPVPATKDKVERARACGLVAAAEAGNVRLVNGPWVEAFLAEAETLPNGDHDDTVDAVTGAMQELGSLNGMGAVASVPKGEREERPADGWSERRGSGRGLVY